VVGAAGLEPATFGSQKRNSEFEKLSEVAHLQRFRAIARLRRLAHLAQLAHMAGIPYPDLTPALSPPSSLVARRAHSEGRRLESCPRYYPSICTRI
jgi:hypothetical protein